MALDRTINEKAYLIGRAAALTEDTENTPDGFPALVCVNPLQKLYPWVVSALKKGGEIVEVMSRIDEMPSMMNAENGGKFWVGYYHQKTELQKDAERKRIGLRIQQLREEKGMSQKELAELCGLSTTHIARIEDGEYSVKSDILSAVALVLGTKVDII